MINEIKKDLSNLDQNIKDTMQTNGFPLTFQGLLDFQLATHKQATDQKLATTKAYYDNLTNESKARSAAHTEQGEKNIQKIKDDFNANQKNIKDEKLKTAFAKAEDIIKTSGVEQRTTKLKIALLRIAPISALDEYKKGINSMLIEYKKDLQL